MTLTFERLSGSTAAGRRDLVSAIYAESYVDAIATCDPFDSVAAFMERFDHYIAVDGFDMIVGHSDSTPVAQTWGWPLRENASWWTGLVGKPQPQFTRETGRRTFALSEIMVAKKWAGQGIAHAIHNALLSSRSEERATLLVEPDNTTARRAYLHWGWKPAGQLRPGWDDAPLFDVLVRPLPI